MRALAALALLLLPGCAGIEPAHDPLGRYVVHLTSDLKFAPQDATVPLNATVVWVNDSGVPHDVQGALRDGGPDGPGFSSGRAGDIAPGASYNFTFTAQGTYDYYCYLHHSAGMVASITVR
ncbi:MAG: cupredoxin domain-containing protein [Thermoplasmatota archaeon]